MKKVLVIVVFIVVAVAISSCKSQKNGCGLTGSVEIEHLNTFDFKA